MLSNAILLLLWNANSNQYLALMFLIHRCIEALSYAYLISSRPDTILHYHFHFSYIYICLSIINRIDIAEYNDFTLDRGIILLLPLQNI